tara:strand:- start:184 stop:549 length:366 start_codon:yes stop_codon:yes gene_type:complete
MQNLFRYICTLLFCFTIFQYPFQVKANSFVSINSDIQIERKLAYKYCESIDKNLFEGLENELILKYEYFFSSLPKDSVKDVNQFMEDFKSQVYSICSSKLTFENQNEFNKYFEKFYLDKSN